MAKDDAVWNLKKHAALVPVSGCDDAVVDAVEPRVVLVGLNVAETADPALLGVGTVGEETQHSFVLRQVDLCV